MSAVQRQGRWLWTTMSCVISIYPTLECAACLHEDNNHRDRLTELFGVFVCSSLTLLHIHALVCHSVWNICSGIHVCVHEFPSPPRQSARRRPCASWMSAGEGSSSPSSTTTHREDWQPNRIISRFLQNRTELPSNTQLVLRQRTGCCPRCLTTPSVTHITA